MNDPHYLRFVRTLALVSSIGGAGCGMATTPDDVGSTGQDAATAADTGADAVVVLVDADTPDTAFSCASCQCSFGGVDAGLPACEPDHTVCCVAVGPLAPPDLAA
jgi:hypothetical protein